MHPATPQNGPRVPLKENHRRFSHTYRPQNQHWIRALRTTGPDFCERFRLSATRNAGRNGLLDGIRKTSCWPDYMPCGDTSPRTSTTRFKPPKVIFSDTRNRVCGKFVSRVGDFPKMPPLPLPGPTRSRSKQAGYLSQREPDTRIYSTPARQHSRRSGTRTRDTITTRQTPLFLPLLWLSGWFSPPAPIKAPPKSPFHVAPATKPPQS